MSHSDLHFDCHFCILFFVCPFEPLCSEQNNITMQENVVLSVRSAI